MVHLRTSKAVMEQETRRKSNRIGMARLRASETLQDQETRRKSNSLQMMQTRISETAQNREMRLECQRNITSSSRMAIWKDKENAAYSYNPSINYKSDASCILGSMSITCQFCSAMKFKGEAPGLCCSGGKVHLPVLRDPPEPLHTLLSSDSVCAKLFRKNIRRYNSCFQMTSFGSSKQIIESGFMPTFKVQGQVYHKIGSLFPCPAEEPKFLQIYFIDSNMEQAEQRCKIVQQVKQDLVLKLQDMLHHNNSYIKSFKSAIEKLGPDFRIIIHADRVPTGEHSRRFNEPTTSEVAVIMAGDQHGKRDIILETRNNSIQKIADTHRSYDALQDAVVSEGNVSDVGQLIILPSSFTGSPRYMHERTQDAMTYVRNYGRPDLFITFTCNPAWSEIENELFLGQKPHNRHDLLARVFHGKLKILMNLINKGKFFGVVQCYMYTIEWQKRGLPHAHILVWLQETLHVHKVDDFISAEIPNPEEDPELFNCITTQMVHGPCGAIKPFSPCMKDGKCTKRYPRDFLKETQTGKDGYPLYRRRRPEDGGFSAVMNVRHSDVVVDNRWIVPYCPLLSRIFCAHINVEYCNSIKSIKYVCKYINKGCDMAVFDVTSSDCNAHNEIYRYEMGRYISSNEAVWRILNFPIHERYPTVIHLSVHLENGQRVYFTEGNAAERARFAPETTLTAFFRLCNEDEFARTLFYHQVPRYYTWDSKNKKWSRRKVGQSLSDHPGIKSTDAIGRVYTVHPNNSECFHLRLLLHEVPGPMSFQYLKTIEGRICSSYKEACQVRGLLENDEHWNATLEEAAFVHSPRMLRDLFAVMLQVCALSNPNQLWINHRESLSEDILHQVRIQQQNMDLEFSTKIFNEALIIIEDKVRSLGGSDLKSIGLPPPDRDSSTLDDVLRERTYNISELRKFLDENEDKMLPDQREIFQKITEAVFQEIGGISGYVPVFSAETSTTFL
ncbi:ATP-dependent DNA helicase [Trichonephila clavata]|uniref:ATP-dependent DNA helicase n=2 Tax=Trichonephila clavata TaxID=2740835 RepID=A0A8X6LLT1_TRICU|nr:ATP-dependent DNA helicase [Trichonephila clavata]